MAHSSPSASTTADSEIGAPAAPSDPGDSTDVGDPFDQPSACGSETETDIAAADEPPGTTSTDDSESPTCGETDSRGQIWSSEVSDDSWLEDWDMTIHRCSHCDRPFVSAARLAQHVQAWHTGRAPVLRPYRKPPSNTGAGSGELVVIVPDGDLFLSVSEGPARPGRRGMRFQVSSPILWLASRVFNSMFGPKSRFQEAIALRRSNITGFPPVVVTLDDDPETLKFVLTALYFPYGPFSTPTYKMMVEVAAVCDKYELHRALQPVADRYFLPIGKKISNFSGSSNWLLISYVFGYEQIFAAVSKYIILHLTDAEQTAYVDCRTPAKVTGMTRSVPPSLGAIPDQVPFSNPRSASCQAELDHRQAGDLPTPDPEEPLGRPRPGNASGEMSQTIDAEGVRSASARTSGRKPAQARTAGRYTHE